MSYNETIYSGVSAHPAAEVASELHQREWQFSDGNFLDLVGAVVTLAREVDRITPRVVEADSGPRVPRMALPVHLADLAALIEHRTGPNGMLSAGDTTHVFRVLRRQATVAKALADERERVATGLRNVYEMLNRERQTFPIDSIVHVALANIAALLDVLEEN